MTTRRSIELEMDLELAQFRRRMQEVVRISGREGAEAGDEFADGVRDGVDEASDAARRGAKSAGDAWKGVGSALQQGLALAGVTVAAEAVVDYANSVIEARQEVINLSKATGISTSTFGAFELAAGRAGVEVDEILGGFEDFGEVLFDFTQGGGRAEEALRMLGFTSDELAGRLDDVDGVAIELIEKMRGIEDAGLRNAVAQQLFGDAGNRLNAILGDAPLDEWIAAAAELGVTVDENAVAATEEWNEATAILGEAFSKTGGDLVSFLQQAASPVIRNFSLGFVFLREAATEAIDVVIERFGRFSRIVETALAGDFSEAIELASDEFDTLGDDVTRVGNAAFEGARRFYDTQLAVSDMTESVSRGATAMRRLADDTEAATKAQADYRALAAFNTQLTDELATAHDQLGDIAAQAASDQLTEIDQVLQRRDEQLAQIRELEEVTGETAQSRAAAEAVVERAVRDRIAVTEALEQQAHEERERRAEQERQRRERDTEETIDQLQSVLDAAVDTAVRITDALAVFASIQLDTMEANADATRSQLDETQAQLAELNAMIIEDKEQLTEAEIRIEIARLEELEALQQQELAAQQAEFEQEFEKRKQLEIAGVIISGAAAGVAALAPPPVGAGPIVGAIIATGIAATTAATVAQIRAEEAPQFHTGFAGYTDADDEFDARLSTGESVNNARATEALGGPSGVAELNATGRLPTRAARPMNPSELGRMLGQLLAQELETGREFTRAIHRGRPRTAVRPVFAR